MGFTPVNPRILPEDESTSCGRVDEFILRKDETDEPEDFLNETDDNLDDGLADEYSSGHVGSDE